LATDIELDFTNASDPGVPITSVASASGVNDYTFDSPVVDSISPAAGPLAGGTTVTISGSGFDIPGLTLAKVEFHPSGDTNGSNALLGTDASVVSDNEITVTAPDATTAADGEPELAVTVSVLFDGPGDPASSIESAPGTAGADDYLFGDISPPTAPTGAVSSEDCTSSTESGTCDVTNDGTTVSTDGEGAVTVSQYGSDPVGSPAISASGEYFDVQVAPRSNFSTLTITACNLQGATSLEWWNGSAWSVVSPQTFSAGPPPCVTAVLSSTSSPTIAQLTGTVFAGELTSSAQAVPVENPVPPTSSNPIPPTGTPTGTSSALATTGAELSQTLFAGGGLIGIGLFLVGVSSISRRRRTATAISPAEPSTI
jgi:hypothetical protein